MTQTIQAAKEFLDAELAKADSLEYLGVFAKVLFKGAKGDFLKAKKLGVGRETIVKFLGGNWTEHKVRIALDVVSELWVFYNKLNI